jgi:hypothetical protein
MSQRIMGSVAVRLGSVMLLAGLSVWALQELRPEDTEAEQFQILVTGVVGFLMYKARCCSS